MMLPNGWKKVGLFDVVSIESTLVDPKKEPYSEMNLIAPDHIQSETGVVLAHVPAKEQHAISGKYLVKKGDVIYSKIRPYLKKACRATEECLCSADMYPFTVSDQMDASYLLHMLLSETFTKYANTCSARTGIPKINREDLALFQFCLPPLEEQKKIAATLSVWDSAIEKMEKLIDAKDNFYACFLASSIKTNSYVKLGTFLTEVSERNKDEKIQQVLSVSNSKGFVLPEEQFDRKVASENLSNYKIVHLGQYAYNPSRINVGSIARLNNWNEAVISPMYTVFEIDNQEQLDSDFLLHWLNSSEAKQRIKNSAQGSVRETVGFGDLCKIKIPRFDLKKQQKIVSV